MDFFDWFGRYGSNSDILERGNDAFFWRDFVGNTPILTPGAGRNGGAAIHQGILRGLFNTPRVTQAFGGAIKVGPGDPLKVQLMDSASSFAIQDQISFDASTGAITVTSGSNTWSSPNNVIPPNTYFSYAAIFTIDASAGAFQIYVDLQLVSGLNQTGVSTQTTGNADFDAILLYPQFNDDYYTDFWTNPTLIGGDAFSVWVPPNGAGASTQFTPNPGSNANWQNVDGLSGGSNDNASSTVGQSDLFTIPNTAVAGGTILALEPGYQGSRDAPGGRALATRVRSSSGLITNGTGFVLSSGRTIRGTVFNTDPATSSAWLAGSLPQVGYEVTS